VLRRQCNCHKIDGRQEGIIYEKSSDCLWDRRTYSVHAYTRRVCDCGRPVCNAKRQRGQQRLNEFKFQRDDARNIQDLRDRFRNYRSRGEQNRTANDTCRKRQRSCHPSPIRTIATGLIFVTISKNYSHGDGEFAKQRSQRGNSADPISSANVRFNNTLLSNVGFDYAYHGIPGVPCKL